MRALQNIFMLPDISNYLCEFLPNKSNEFLSINKGLKYDFIYWHGSENRNKSNLERIEYRLK